MEQKEIKKIEKIAKKNGIHHIDGTSILIINHDKIRYNFKRFTSHLPRVQPYYAVKANSLPEIVKTIYDLGGSFDVASYQEFLLINRLIKNLPLEERQNFIWEKIIYAHPIKNEGTLNKLNRYKPLIVYDNEIELKKIKKYAPNAGLILRIWSPNTGSVVELSNKFGAEKSEAVNLIAKAIDSGLTVEGLSFHVGSQCLNSVNYTTSLENAYNIFEEADSRSYKIGHLGHGDRKRILDIGGGFPVRYNGKEKRFKKITELLNNSFDRLFSEKEFEIIAEPGRFMVANSATLVAKIIGKATRRGKTSYYINDGVYHTFSGQLFDHINYTLKSFKKGPQEISTIFGQTCDGFDVQSQATLLPDLDLGDLVYAESMGAYTNASSTYFNGFPPAKIIHINQ